jgi:acyl carrier protein
MIIKNNYMETDTITKKKIKEMLLDFICRQFLVDREDVELDKSLIDTGIIDSMGLIEISTFIKQNFNFMITIDQMTRQNFGSVLLMIDYIDKNKKPNL